MSTTASVDEDHDLGQDLPLFGRLTAANQTLANELKRDPATMAYGLDQAYRMRPHLRVIGDAMADVLAGVDDRLMIICPPQTGKSTLVAEWGPFWWFANRPGDDIVIASYGLDLALDRSKGVRDRIAEHGHEYGLTIKPGSSAAHDWHLVLGGHLRAIGIGGGLSGFSANIIFLDDPHKDRAEAESPRIRNAVHDWWSSTALKRLQPDMGAVIAIQTRWGPDDWAGRRLKEEGRKEEGGRWRVVHLPAVADAKFGKDPLGRAPGEPLPHPKIPTRDRASLSAWWAEKKRTSIVRDWHSLEQGDPQPVEGALVSEQLLEMIRARDSDVEPQKIAVAVDPSGGGRDTAGIIGGFLGSDKRCWWTHDRTGHMSSAEWSEAACLLAHEINAAVIFVEVNYGGDMATLAIRTAWKKLQGEGKIPSTTMAPLVKPVRAKQGKLLRAEPVAGQMIQDKIRTKGILIDLEREWAVWQPTDPDSPGRIDASVILTYGLLPMPSAGSSQPGMPSGHMPVTGASPLGGGGTMAGMSGLGPLG